MLHSAAVATLRCLPCQSSSSRSGAGTLPLHHRDGPRSWEGTLPPVQPPQMNCLEIEVASESGKVANSEAMIELLQ